MKKNSFSVLKLIIFMMFFLVVLTFFLIIYIIPAMKQYKTNEVVLKKYEKKYRIEKVANRRLKKEITILEEKYKNDLDRCSKKFDLKNFRTFTSKYMNIENISKIEDKKEYQLYKIDASLNSLENFYKYIENINNYSNIVKITFPIKLKKEEKSYKITLNVTIFNK